MKAVFAVGAGGFLGALARYALTLGFARLWPRSFPLGTLVINVSGSFVLGWLMAWAAARTHLDPAWRLAIATGFIGAFTTFSTLEYETKRLADAGLQGLAALNLALSITAGYAAVSLGARLGR